MTPPPAASAATGSRTDPRTGLRTDRLAARLRHARPIDACSAVLLPYTHAGEPDIDAFSAHLLRTADCGIAPAINMDTGFGPQLSAVQRGEIVRLTASLLKGRRFIAGAGCFGAERDPMPAYRAAVDEIVAAGGVPIVYQSAMLTALKGRELADAYAAIIGDAPEALGFELGTMFAPFGKIYSLDEFKRLMDIPALVGVKHSSLQRGLELQRLELRDADRPEFKIYTGNDLAIDMVMYGSDYLLGLSTFHPEAFALRDRWWAEGDARFYELNDSLQALGAVGFRRPVPAYKDSARAYLVARGVLPPESRVHPACPRRPENETELLAPLAEQVETAMNAHPLDA